MLGLRRCGWMYLHLSSMCGGQALAEATFPEPEATFSFDFGVARAVAQNVAEARERKDQREAPTASTSGTRALV